MKEHARHYYARGIIVFISLLYTLMLQAQDVYLWGTANGTRFHLKLLSYTEKTVQVHANSETAYTGDIIIPEKITADDGNEYTITLVDQSAFKNNTNITSVFIPGTVTEIGQYTFSGCTALKTVKIGEGVNDIWKYAFENCTALETISFPVSNLKFEKETFTGSNNVKEVYVYDTNPRGVQGTDPFELIGPKATLFVPYGTQDTYKTLNGWKDFTVKPFLILDESKTFEVTSRIENIRTVFKRKIKSGTWNSFCIPFNLSSADVQTVFGSGTRVLEFDPNSTESTLNFVDVTSISANKPYLIKPSVSWNTYTFDSQTIDPTATLTVSGTNYDFTGSYSNGYTPVGSYFISSNKFYRATDDTNVLKGYRAYLTPANTSSGAKSLTFATSETTGIGMPLTENGQTASDIYSMDGRLIRRQAASFEGLAPGLYILNKKKIRIQ